MNGDDFQPRDDEPAVTNQELLAMVEAVRAEPEPETKVEFSAIGRQLDARGSGFRTGVAAGVLLAAAAGVAFWFMQPDKTNTAAPPDDAAMVRVGVEPPPVVPAPAMDPLAESSEEVALASAVSIAWEGGAAPKALAPMEVQLRDGRYEIGLEGIVAGELIVHALDRTLVVERGRLVVDTRGATAVVVLETGVAAWVDADGNRTPLVAVTQPVTRFAVPARPAKASPAELAGQAEALLAGGQRKQALVLLRKLATRHPGTAAGKTALLDLGRELDRQGMTDDARCAYTVYLQRYPSGQLRAEVERKLDKLGGTPRCDGLDPR